MNLCKGRPNPGKLRGLIALYHDMYTHLSVAMFDHDGACSKQPHDTANSTINSQSAASPTSRKMVNIKSRLVNVRRSFIDNITPADPVNTYGSAALLPRQLNCMETKRSKRLSGLFRRGSGFPRNPFHKDAIFRQHEAHVHAAAASASDAQKTPLDSSNAPIKCQTVNLKQQQQQFNDETTVFLRSLNSARRAEGASPLTSSPSFSSRVQTYASRLPNAEPFKPGRMSLHTIPATQLNPTSLGGVRLIGPPGHGALTCAERWCGGKYRRHGFGAPGEVARAEGHAENCPCHLHPVWSVIVDQRWVWVGFGKTEDGRWVVELYPRDSVSPLVNGHVAVQKDEEVEVDCERAIDGDGAVSVADLQSERSSLHLAGERAPLYNCTSESSPESPNVGVELEEGNASPHDDALEEK
ncbi:hypothetical protein M433DRAFT_324732 [Acidomyces richmondensis BFW]|nr:MAG: hypothetical protein FE78DRAFT_463814 [Acidomyces sp. 'richmondensis']KYG44003.1 hypothetical protein M433DRAFT_324732 [Acidomyces richmondensis BFW]